MVCGVAGQRSGVAEVGGCRWRRLVCQGVAVRREWELDDLVALMNIHDKRALTPLFWSNVALHGTFALDLDKRLDYDRGAPSADPNT
jgi:hypothetical protein